jgi:hypothetical protein
MAKTTATVTVGADTSPFERKMRTLGKGLTGGITAGVGRVGGMAMSGLGAGLGIGAAFLGLQSLGSIFDQMRAVSPALNAELNKLRITIGNALFPAAEKLAMILRDNMPMIQNGLSEFGSMLADAIQFWTEDAFNPEVWKDIGIAISESIADALDLLPRGVESTGRTLGGALGGDLGAEAGAGAAAGLTDVLTTFNPMYWLYKYNEAAAGLVLGKSDERASAL